MNCQGGDAHARENVIPDVTSCRVDHPAGLAYSGSGKSSSAGSDGIQVSAALPNPAVAMTRLSEADRTTSTLAILRFLSLTIFSQDLRGRGWENKECLFWQYFRSLIILKVDIIGYRFKIGRVA